MKLFIVLLIQCIGFINANQQSEQVTNGITFALKAADPDSYDHQIGGGKWSSGIDTVKGNYYAVGERISLLLQITTDDTFSLSSSAEFDMELVLRDGEGVLSVVNNCIASSTECSTGAAKVVPTLSTDGRYEIFFQGLTKNSRTVFRIDLVIYSDLDCECSCHFRDGHTSCVCPFMSVPRKPHISGAKKRAQQSEMSHRRDKTRELGRDEYSVALYINDYYVDDNYYTFPVKFIPFADNTLCQVLCCEDYTSCFTGTPSGKIRNSYKDRTCDYVEASCDDGDDETNDRCVPPSPYDYERNMPPNCIHTPWDESLHGYCYYFDPEKNGYDCEYSCTSNDDCETDGVCYEYDDCSVDESPQGDHGYCYYGDDYGYDCETPCTSDDDCEVDGGCYEYDEFDCPDEQGESLYGYCYYEDDDYGIDCENPCAFDDDCEYEGGYCYEDDESECSVDALQQENLESANNSKQQSVGSFSPLQLFGIIGGCVGFVVMVVFVVVIYKKSIQVKSINEETIASLQVPLN